MRSIEVPAPRILLRSPAEGTRIHGQIRLLANTDPERASQIVRFERRIATGAWTAIGTDASSPDYRTVDDISGLGLAEGTQIHYRAVLIEPDGTEVPTRPRLVTVGPAPA